MPDITLRPMTIGEILDRTFSLYKSNFWLFVGIGTIPYLVLLIIGLLVGLAGAGVAGMAGGVKPVAGTPAFSAAMFGGMFAGVLVVIIAYFFLIGACQAATVFAVSDLYMGQATTVRNAYRRVGVKIFRIALLFFLLMVMFGAGIFFFMIVLVILRNPVIMILGFVLLIIPTVYFFCRVAVSVPAAMLEDASAVRSIERSFFLTKGFAGQVFLIFLLVVVITYVAIFVFQMPFIVLSFASMAAQKQPSITLVIFQQLANFVSQILVGPIGTIAFSLMYYNLRVRKEAFDIQHLMASMDANPTPSAPSVA